MRDGASGRLSTASLNAAGVEPLASFSVMREAMEHLFARYREMRPLFLVPALPIKVE